MALYLKQSYFFGDLASLQAQTGIAPGFIALVDGYIRYTSVPSGVFIVDNIHVFAGQGSIDWIDEETILNGKFPTLAQFEALEAHGGGGSLPPLGNEQVIIGNSDGYTVRQLTQDDILPGFSINSFSLAGTAHYAPVVEIGTILSVIVASASYANSAVPGSANITDTLSGSWTFSTPFAAGSRTGTVTFSSLGNSWTVNLSATYNSVTKTASVTVNWWPLVYHGSSAPGPYNAAFITSLATATLQGSRATTFTDTIGPGQYDYYAIPTIWETPTFIYGVLPGGWSLVQSGILVTNSQGIQISYDLWKTNQSDLGSTTWTVT